MKDLEKISQATLERLLEFIEKNLKLEVDIVATKSNDLELLEATASSKLMGINADVILTIDSFFATKFLHFLGLPAKEPLDSEYKYEAAKEFLNIILGNMIKKIEVNRTLDFKNIENIDKLHITTSTTLVFDKIHSQQGVLKLIFIEKENE